MGTVISAALEPSDRLPDEQLALIAAATASKKKQRRRSRRGPQSNYVPREEQVRRLLETMTSCEWPNVRPPWLRVGKRRLEIDCWCARLSTAIEVSGEHHFKRIAAWQSEAEFERQQANDFKKRRICQELGILFLVVGSRSHVPDSELPRHVLGMLARHRVLARAPLRLPVI